VRRPLALLVLAGSLVLALAAPASAQAPADIAAALKQNPVYADPAARPALTPAQAEQIRLRIAEHAPGRLAIAVVSARAVRAAGGIKELAHAIDRDFDVNGALLVLDSQNDNAWVVVSYDEPGLAVRAVQQGFAGKAPFFDHVLRTVDRVGEADPGPGTPAGGPQTPQSTTPHTDVDVDQAIKTVFIVAGGIILVIVLLIAVAIFGRTRRRRRTDPATGLSTPAPVTVSTTTDAQRQAAEKAFGGDD
jgi:hypothetical protein